jgi:hypothetical protein
VTPAPEPVDCPRLHARLLLPRCIDRHLGRSEALDPEAKEICATCPLGAQRATVAGVRLRPGSSGAEPGQEGQAGRGCCNPECQRRARAESRYCSRACKMAVDRIRAKVCYDRKQGRLRQADELQLGLDRAAEQRGWPAVRRPTTSDRVRSQIEQHFGEPLLVDGQRLWLSGQVWRALGYRGSGQVRKLLRRSWQRDVVDGEDTWVMGGRFLHVGESKVRVKVTRTCSPFMPYSRVFTELGLWKLALLARTTEALQLRARVFEAMHTLRAYWQQEG